MAFSCQALAIKYYLIPAFAGMTCEVVVNMEVNSS